ncbi:MAG: class IV adenylate cyclase [Patescibacteria group bacterium]|nr:class IV adenylate cyclase [Patescibacteria group bacterium]
MQEIEIKILGINKSSLQRKLKACGYSRVFSGKIVCWHFDFPDKSLRKAGKLIRLRDFGKGKVELTYKGSKEKGASCKIRQEIETEVGSFEEASEIFSKIGLKGKFYSEKKRTSYKKGRVRVEIDEFLKEGVTYAEIEAMSEKLVYRTIEELGLEGYETSCESAMKVVGKSKIKDQKSKIKDCRVVVF